MLYTRGVLIRYIQRYFKPTINKDKINISVDIIPMQA